jgi:polo-like kinase 1
LQAEIKIHRMLKHKHVCEFKHFFEDRENCYILLELCHNQSMNEMIKRRKRLTEPEAAFFMSQLLLAVQYMHENNVIHRDLKLGNLFIDKQLHIKVGDLGLATRVDDKDEKRKTICGTPNYIAPEIIQSDKSKRGHSFEVDVWSMGVILYTLLVGKPPYEAKNVKATYQRILRNEYSFPPHVPISSHAKSLIVNLLQSDPSHRSVTFSCLFVVTHLRQALTPVCSLSIPSPSLDQIAAHPFLASNFIPTALPSNALHFAPQWHVTSDRIELIRKGDDCAPSSTIHRGADPNGQSQKPGIPRPSSRQPFGYRDINSNKASTVTTSTSATTAPKPSIDMERVVRTAIAISGVASDSSSSTAVTKGRISASAVSSTSSTPSGSDNVGAGSGFSKFKSIYSCGFKIFEEPSTPKTPHSHSMRSLDEAALVQRTKALSIASTGETIRDGPAASRSQSVQQHQLASYTSFASSSSGSVVLDGEILQSMVNRLDAVLDITASRKGMYRLQVPRSVSPVHGPRKWVVRYVDYTSKYGLGFLLNDGSSGVYFNDSTKTVLDAGGDVFQYMERKSLDDAAERHHQVPPTTVIETHTLSSYPNFLKKKVTLLKHFRNYLLEQYKEEGDEMWPAAGKTGGSSAPPTNLVYVKKWVRTRHAILFRLSDQTVQVVFFDQSELLLTPDDRYITYVDKSRKRLTYPFTDDLIGASSELETRLKYTKEILSSLIQRR